MGNHVGVVDPLGRVSLNKYDRLDRLTEAIDPDPDGTGSTVPHATKFTYDAAGNLLTSTNGDNETDAFVYDSLSRQTRSTDGRGDATVRRYDDVGNLLRQVDPAGNRTDYQYDGYDRVVAETAYEGATANAREFVYDNNRKLIITVDRNGKAIRYKYDRLDRVDQEKWFASEADARANASGTGATAHSDVFDFVYDDLGRLAEQRYVHRVLNPGGTAYGRIYRVTDAWRYDGLDRVTEHNLQPPIPTIGPKTLATSTWPTATRPACPEGRYFLPPPRKRPRDRVHIQMYLSHAHGNRRVPSRNS